MTTLHPRETKDLALAPVAVAIDTNLARLRDLTVPEIAVELELQLDRPARNGYAGERAERILEAALRGVDLHGWHAGLTSDDARVRLSGGSVSLDVGLSAAILDYIRG